MEQQQDRQPTVEEVYAIARQVIADDQIIKRGLVEQLATVQAALRQAEGKIAELEAFIGTLGVAQAAPDGQEGAQERTNGRSGTSGGRKQEKGAQGAA